MAADSYNLNPCRCGGRLKFHQDATECPDGCHLMICRLCRMIYDASDAADPHNESLTLEELRAKIVTHWNCPTGEA